MTKRRTQQGYTLIEMAIAIAIIGTLSGMVLSMMAGQREAIAMKAQKEQMKVLEEALAYYVKLRGRLPCPADPALPETDANFAREDCTAGGSIVTIAGASSNEDIYIGMLPTRTLALSDRHLYDEWGSRINYVVIAALTVDASSFAAYTTTEDTGVIHITDAANNQTTQQLPDNVVAYALISHGKDKKGGYNRVGSITNACDPTTVDGANCDDTDYAFVDADINDSKFASTYYHDMIRWRDLAQLRAAVDVTGANVTYYTYIADTGNNRVLKYNPNGSFLSALDSSACPTSMSFNSPTGIAIDSSNNVFVADTGNHLIKRFDSSGACTAELAATGITGSFDPTYLAVASSGNLYAVDGNRIAIVNSDGSYNSEFDGTGSSGTFSSPTGIAIDGSGDVYVADTGNNKLKKFNSDGSFDTLEINGSTGGGSAFTNPKGVALDTSGNIYVADSSLALVQKYDSAGSYLDVFDDGGNLNNPQAVGVSANNDVYILDTGNNVVKIFQEDKTSLGNISALDAPAPAGLSGALGIGLATQ